MVRGPLLLNLQCPWLPVSSSDMCKGSHTPTLLLPRDEEEEEEDDKEKDEEKDEADKEKEEEGNEEEDKKEEENEEFNGSGSVLDAET
ncbi:unnamed protein product [Arctogadus glacialis]